MKKIINLLGVIQTPVSHAEKIVSAVGGFVAILCVYYSSQLVVGATASAVLVASMGASSVLLFAAPHSQFSQPWPLLGGHLISAIIGVTCASYFGSEIVAAAIAVGASIGTMYYLRCMHPPGGATALSAVVGGDSVLQLGYEFVVNPILVNIIIILLVAVIFNNIFHWRRYPVFFQKAKHGDQGDSVSDSVSTQLQHDDLVAALAEIDSFIDISEHDLLRIYDILTQKSQAHTFAPEKIVVGGYYSNGKHGEEWSVRQVVDESPGSDGRQDIVVYKVVAGQDRRSSGYSSRKDFLRWAKHQVIRDDKAWKRLDQSE